MWGLRYLVLYSIAPLDRNPPIVLDNLVSRLCVMSSGFYSPYRLVKEQLCSLKGCREVMKLDKVKELRESVDDHQDYTVSLGAWQVSNEIDGKMTPWL